MAAVGEESVRVSQPAVDALTAEDDLESFNELSGPQEVVEESVQEASNTLVASSLVVPPQIAHPELDLSLPQNSSLLPASSGNESSMQLDVCSVEPFEVPHYQTKEEEGEQESVESFQDAAAEAATTSEEEADPAQTTYKDVDKARQQDYLEVDADEPMISEALLSAQVLLIAAAVVGSTVLVALVALLLRCLLAVPPAPAVMKPAGEGMRNSHDARKPSEGSSVAPPKKQCAWAEEILHSVESKSALPKAAEITLCMFDGPFSSVMRRPSGPLSPVANLEERRSVGSPRLHGNTRGVAKENETPKKAEEADDEVPIKGKARRSRAATPERRTKSASSASPVLTSASGSPVLPGQDGGDAQKRTRRSRAATPERASPGASPGVYKAPKMFLADQGAHGLKPHNFKSPRLKEVADLEIAKEVASALDAEEAIMALGLPPPPPF